MKPLAESNEIELYLAIDYCGAFIWRMNHELYKGNIPQEEQPAIEKDVAETRKTQLEAVRELPRFGIQPLDDQNRPTDAYWAWYRTWDHWKKSLSDDEWKTFNTAATRGFTEEEIQQYKAAAFANPPSTEFRYP